MIGGRLDSPVCLKGTVLKTFSWEFSEDSGYSVILVFFNVQTFI